MTAKNTLLQAPPYAVDRAIKRLGSNLRTARLRRNLTIEEVGEKIGTGPRAVSGAEKGKVSTGIAVYIALLWTYDLLDQLRDIADPGLDEAGLNLSLSRERARAKQGLDNEF
jgi:transcriptional regulator with XRE-family HTH domain